MTGEGTPFRWDLLAHILGWRRVATGVGTGLALGLLLSPNWKTGTYGLLLRTVGMGFILVVVFGGLEAWPRRLPSWLARWALQVLGVAIAVPAFMFLVYVLSTPAGSPPFWRVQDRLMGFLGLTALGMLVAPWVAMIALLRHINGEARSQALGFELERSEMEKRVLDSRLRLLQAQVEPHFLFNTLANIRELVETQSPQATTVLENLITYLRGAIPRLQSSAMTLEQELALVRAYLEVMHIRMPDRLTFSLRVDQESRALHCPPMAILTLVENAVRHGIDPSEEGGSISIQATARDGLCRIEVLDTGVGVGPGAGSAGTGLANLRERLDLTYAGKARLRISPGSPKGTLAELEFPAYQVFR